MRESFVVNPRSVISPSMRRWYSSRSFAKKIQAFHDKYATVPTDEDIKEGFQNCMKSLMKYLKSKNLCDCLEYTGSSHFE